MSPSEHGIERSEMSEGESLKRARWASEESVKIKILNF